MQGHDEGELRLRYTGRLEFVLKNASIDRVKGFTRVNGQRDTTPTCSGDASRGASLLKSDPLRRNGGVNTIAVMQCTYDCMFNATSRYISVLWPGPRRLSEGRT